MRILDILNHEHKIILSKLEEFRNISIGSNFQGLDELGEFISFFHIYIDQYHHIKEENILFKWMISKNPSLEYGVIAVMEREHESCRDLYTVIKDKYELVKNKNIDEIPNLLTFLRMLVDLLETHIKKEEVILYQMAEQIDNVTDDGDYEMLASFEDVHTKYLDKINHFL